MLAHYKHIIWDWNGTLLDDTWLCVEVLNGLLKKRGRDTISRETYRNHFNFPVIHFYDYLGFDTDIDSFERISREFIDDYELRWLKECRLQAETLSILTQFATFGVNHSVLSAAQQSALEIGIRHFGLGDHFTALIGADNIYAAGKISQGKQWIQQLDCDAQEVVLIGDTVHDHEVAQAIGCNSILMAHGHHSRQRLEATGSSVVDSLSELMQYIRA